VLCGASPVTLDNPAAVAGRRVLVVEDGPTITHGGMPSGAGLFAARRAGAASIVDPHACAAPEIQRVYDAYPHIGPVLPAVGYYAKQLEAMRATIAASDAEVVVAGTPIDLGALLAIEQPVVRARYEYADLQSPGLEGVVRDFLLRRGLLARTVTARATAESPDGEAARGTGDS
jgi:predicted GTPase